MKLKVLGDQEFSITGYGLYKPGEIIEVDENSGKYLLKNPYFIKISEKITKKLKINEKKDI